MARVGCLHCCQEFPSIFELFLHIFTAHKHKDIGLDPQESQPIVEKSTQYRWEMISRAGLNN